MLTERLAGLTVMGFFIGYPVLFVVEAVVILLHYDDPLSGKLAIVGVLFVVAVVTGSPPSSWGCEYCHFIRERSVLY